MVGTPVLGVGAKYIPQLASAHDSAQCAQNVQRTAASKLLQGQSGKLMRKAKSCR